MNYCCESMQRYVKKGEFKYHPKYRAVCAYCKNEREYTYEQFCMGYCPFCGERLPSHLYYEYANVLEQSVGKEYCDITEDEIPEEFKTDEWWKKRGL